MVNDRRVTLGRVFCYSPVTGEIDPDAIHGLPPWLIDFADVQRLAPWLAVILQGHCAWTQLSPRDRQNLTDRRERALVAARSRALEIAELVHTLEHDGIRTAFLKEYAYDQTFPLPGCVEQSDIDLLLHPRDVRRAGERLQSLGYWRVPRPWDNEYRYKHPQRTTVDLQWSLDPVRESEEDAAGRVAGLLRRARTVSIADTDVPVLHPVDNACFLLLHAAVHHGFVPFSKVVTTWSFIVRRQQQITPEELAAALAASGCARVGGRALGIIERLCGYSLPHVGAVAASLPDAEQLALPSALAADLDGYFDASRGDGGADRLGSALRSWCVT